MPMLCRCVQAGPRYAGLDRFEARERLWGDMQVTTREKPSPTPPSNVCMPFCLRVSVYIYVCVYVCMCVLYYIGLRSVYSHRAHPDPRAAQSEGRGDHRAHGISAVVRAHQGE